MLETIRVDPVMLVHGGVDNMPKEMIPFKVKGIKKAGSIGYSILKQSGGTALDAVEAAINSMEEDEVFNAGRGSVLNKDEEIEMDAAIMVGTDLSTGGVTVVKEILHPISLARLVMEKSPHVLLAGDGANRFADSLGVTRIPTSELITPFSRADLRMSTKKHEPNLICRCDTVGAVALDKEGHIAAGSSTGGYSGRMVGRSSDSSKVGCGIYADDRFGGVAVTGHGESIVKLCLSHSIIHQLENGIAPQQAAEYCVNNLMKTFNKETGSIVVSKSGDVGIYCNSQWMPYVHIKSNKMYFGNNSRQCSEETFD